MSIFSNLSNTGLEESKDTLGGFQYLDTDIYTATIKLAYAGESAGGAMSVSFVFDINGQEHRETFYVTNRQKENFFTNGGKKYPLPGYTIVDDICVIASEKPLSEQETEPKVVKLYNVTAKAEVPTEVPVLVDLIGQKVALGIFKQVENKSVKNASGEYEPTEETRELNVVDKVFHPEVKLTVVEAKTGKTEPDFWNKWLEKNKGIVRNRCTYKGSSGTSKSDSPVKKSLFG